MIQKIADNQKIAYITGATGCVGRNLVDVLLRDNWKVIALHRASSDLSKLKDCDVECREVDLLDMESICKAIDVKADALFHVAANVTDWVYEHEEQRRDNVEVTQNLVDFILSTSMVKRFVFTSTGAVTPYVNSSDEEIEKIRSGYIKTKMLSEKVVQRGMEKGLDAVILRPIIVVGKYDYNNYSQILTHLRTSKLKVSLPGSLAFCHAEDVAKGHLAAFEKGKVGEVYYLGGEYTTWYDFFLRASKEIGTKPPLKPFPLWMYYIRAHVEEFVSKITKKKPVLTPEFIDLIYSEEDMPSEYYTKSRSELGYTSAPLDVSLKELCTWYQDTQQKA